MRSEVSIVDVVYAIDFLSNLYETAIGKEVRFQIVLVANSPIDVVPQPIAQRKIWTNFPIILCVDANRILRDIPVSVAKAAACEIRFAEEQLLHIISNPAQCWRHIAAEIAESETGTCLISNTVRYCTLEVSAQLNGVITFYPG